MIHFGDCVLDTQNHVLHRGSESIELQPRVFQVLHYLLNHRDRIVSKQELAEQVWPGQGSSDAVLENTVKTVRQVLGDNGHTQRYIQTFRGSGYRFAVTIEEETVPASSVQAEKSTRPRNKVKILVVDDDPDFLKITATILTKEGFEVLTSNNGNDAVEIATEEKPNVILLDIHMPYVSGLSVLESIRRRNINTRIITCSGIFLEKDSNYIDVDHVVESMKKGADDFIAKPLIKERLLTKIKNALLL